MIPKPRYKTLRPHGGKASLDYDMEQIIWVKDKATKLYIKYIRPEWSGMKMVQEMRTTDYWFAVFHGKICIASSIHGNKCPKRILVKYIPNEK